MERPCKRKPYQHEIILWHLQRYGTVMSREAWDNYGISRTGRIVSRLRKHRYVIDSVRVRRPGWNGRPASCVMYVYRGRR